MCPARRRVQKAWPDRSDVNGFPRIAVRGPVLRLDGGADGDELGRIGAPLVVVDVEADPDDAVCAELVGLLLHAVHRQLSCCVHGLGQFGQLLALAPLTGLDPDVVDRRAHHEAERVEAGLLDQQELVHREVGGEQAVLQLLEPVRRVLGQVVRFQGRWRPRG